MKKETIKIEILILLIISVVGFPISAALIRQDSLRNITKERLKSIKIEKPQLSIVNTWSSDGRAISTKKNHQWYPQICSDGAEGAIITWEDERNGFYGDIFAQRVDLTGQLQWNVEGVAICTENDTQGAPQIIDDGANGAIITWNDKRNGLNYDIYAQKINSSGAIQWIANGTEISTADDDQVVPQIVSDGVGGAIIVWNDLRDGLHYDIYSQRINSTGDVQWTANGTEICTEGGNQIFPHISSDGAGGAIITWEDSRGLDTDIYAQRINSTGNVQWSVNGVAICTANDTQWYTQIVSDGAEGAIITWEDERSGSSDIYAQRVDSTGNVQWTTNGTEICTADEKQKRPQICSDENGGAIITWEDYKKDTNIDIYVQRIDSSGNVQWSSNGTEICTANNDQKSPQICSDRAGGAFITWEDLRSVWNDIYAQRINSNGVVQGTVNGEAVCTADFDQRGPQIFSNKNGGAIITWFDKRNADDYDIYGQFIEIYRSSGDNAFPFEILITTLSIIGGIAIVGIVTFFILRKRRNVE